MLRVVAGASCIYASAVGKTIDVGTSPDMSGDEITQLPGWLGSLPSRQFSGYLDVGASKHLHYWLVESETDPSNAPVVLWLNGGPGCSSLDGFIYEHGPFRLNETNHSQLLRFDHSWSKLANIVYLEAPVGVGFSYSDNSADYYRDDDNTAEDNMEAMQVFFDSFPRWKTNEFFIAGESYAGVYVPTLAEAIVWAQGNATWTGANLTGIAVGNGCTGSEIGSCGGEGNKWRTEYLLGHAFIPTSLKQMIHAECNWSQPETNQCAALISEMHKTIGHVNLYNVFGECVSGSAQQTYGQVNTKAPWSGQTLGGPDACIDSVAASAYFNRPDVIAVMHVKPQPFSWSVCGNQISYRSTRPNLPRDTYPFLINHIKVTIYNGDWDACVPYTDNEAWTEGMGFETKSAWSPWTYGDGQVGGYATTYTANDFTFVTVRGGRHEVPETAPEQAFEMLRRVLTQDGFASASSGNHIV